MLVSQVVPPPALIIYPYWILNYFSDFNITEDVNPYNLSILDFKLVLVRSLVVVVDAYNLSILDFKFYA